MLDQQVGAATWAVNDELHGLYLTIATFDRLDRERVVTEAKRARLHGRCYWITGLPSALKPLPACRAK